MTAIDTTDVSVVKSGDGLTEEQIRPRAMMRDKRGCIEHDRSYLLDRMDRFVRVPCPACGGCDLLPAFAKHGFSYERCGGCETLLMNPRAGADLMSEFYMQSQNYAYWNKHVFPATEDARRQRIFKPRADALIELCGRYGAGTNAIMDVGAAFGTFCCEIRDRGTFDRVIALEPTPDLAATCVKRGLETIESGIEHAELPDDSFDVITAFEVIEHLFDPFAFVSRAAQLLRGGGLLVLSCPNVKGFDVAALGRRSNTIDHEHVNYFHPDSIRILLKRVGLDVLDVSTPGKLDAELVRKAAMEGRVWLDDQPLLSRVLLDEWDRLGSAFQQFLSANGLSSHMWACAKKPSHSGISNAAVSQ